MKKGLLNCPDKRKFMNEEFWPKIFDKNGYSIWYMEYQKIEGEG